jgi:hypothetical protein
MAANRDEDAVKVLSKSHKLWIWSEDELTGRSLLQGLQEHIFTSQRIPQTRLLRFSGNGHTQTSGEGSLGSTVESLKMIASPGYHSARRAVSELRFRPKTTSDGVAENKVDVAICTWASSWERSADSSDGGWWNRYMTDLYQRLELEGLNVVWVPAYATTKDRDRLAEVFAHRQEKVCWRTHPPHLGLITEILAELARILLRFQQNRKQLENHPRFEVAGVDLSPWVLRDIRHLLLVRAFAHLYMHETQREVLGRLSPSVALYKDELSSRGLMLTTTQLPNTSYWGVQHGTIPPQHWQYRHPSELCQPDPVTQRDFIHYAPYPDKFLTYGDPVVELMSTTGYSSQRLEVIGSLRHDALFERATSTDLSPDLVSRQRHRLPLDRPVLLICTGLPQDIPGWLRRVVQAAKEMPLSCHIAIKVHWNFKDDLAFANNQTFESIFEDLDWSHWTVYKSDLFELMEAANVVLTGTSTTGLEAAILKRPLICLETSLQGYANPYVEDGLALPANTTEEAIKAISTALKPNYRSQWLKVRDQFLRRHMINIDRPAVDALADLLHKQRS